MLAPRLTSGDVGLGCGWCERCDGGWVGVVGVGGGADAGAVWVAVDTALVTPAEREAIARILAGCPTRRCPPGLP